jgi:hypothetical protein
MGFDLWQHRGANTHGIKQRLVETLMKQPAPATKTEIRHCSPYNGTIALQKQAKASRGLTFKSVIPQNRKGCQTHDGSQQSTPREQPIHQPFRCVPSMQMAVRSQSGCMASTNDQSPQVRLGLAAPLPYTARHAHGCEDNGDSTHRWDVLLRARSRVVVARAALEPCDGYMTVLGHPLLPTALRLQARDDTCKLSIPFRCMSRE